MKRGGHSVQRNEYILCRGERFLVAEDLTVERMAEDASVQIGARLVE